MPKKVQQTARAEQRRNGKRPRGLVARKQRSADQKAPPKRGLENIIEGWNAQYASLLALPFSELRAAVRAMSPKDRRSAVLTWIPDEPRGEELTAALKQRLTRHGATLAAEDSAKIEAEAAAQAAALTDALRKGRLVLLEIVDALSSLAAGYSGDGSYTRLVTDAYLALVGGTDLAAQAKKELVGGVKKAAGAILSGEDMWIVVQAHGAVLAGRWPQYNITPDGFRAAVQAWAAAERPEKRKPHPPRWRPLCDLVVSSGIDPGATPGALETAWKRRNREERA